MMPLRRVAIVAGFAMLAFAASVCAQTLPPPAPPPPPPPQTVPPPPPPAPQPGAATSAAAPIPQELLDSLLAPIALYPDELLSQILMASTYPLEVVEAARFVKANSNLKGPALDNALKDKAWDPSVLSLASFPQVLDMMSEKLDWTQRLGDAFLNDQAAVMSTVQALRWRAQQAGNLHSTPQQQIVAQEKIIYIQPAQPQYVYVPVYNPAVIYGPWWAPAYPPWFWYPPPIWGYPALVGGALAAGFVWGTARPVTVNNWGWSRPDWRGGRVNITITANNIWVNRPGFRDAYRGGGVWRHNVDHRRGVAYRDTVTRGRYRPSDRGAVQTRESFRGREPVAPRPGTPAVRGASSPSAPAPRASAETRPAYEPESRSEAQRAAQRGAQSRAAANRRPGPSADREQSGPRR